MVTGVVTILYQFVAPSQPVPQPLGVPAGEIPEGPKLRFSSVEISRGHAELIPRLRIGYQVEFFVKLIRARTARHKSQGVDRDHASVFCQRMWEA